MIAAAATAAAASPRSRRDVLARHGRRGAIAVGTSATSLSCGEELRLRMDSPTATAASRQNMMIDTPLSRMSFRVLDEVRPPHPQRPPQDHRAGLPEGLLLLLLLFVAGVAWLLRAAGWIVPFG